MDTFTAVVYGLVPSIGIGFLFYKVMRIILEGDRRERLAHSQWEAEQDRLAAEQAASVRESTAVAGPTDGPVQARLDS